MAYTIVDSPVRLIRAEVNTSGPMDAFGGPSVTLYAPLYAPWECDPCAPSSRRYSINGKQIEPWYAVATVDDTLRDILCKMEFALKVEIARRAVWDAEYALRKLTH